MNLPPYYLPQVCVGIPVCQKEKQTPQMAHSTLLLRECTIVTTAALSQWHEIAFGSTDWLTAAPMTIDSSSSKIICASSQLLRSSIWKHSIDITIPWAWVNNIYDKLLITLLISPLAQCHHLSTVEHHR